MGENQTSISCPASTKSAAVAPGRRISLLLASTVIAWSVSAIIFLCGWAPSEPPYAAAAAAAILFIGGFAITDRGNGHYLVIASIILGMILGALFAPVYSERTISRVQSLWSFNWNNFGAVNCNLLGGIICGTLMAAWGALKGVLPCLLPPTTPTKFFYQSRISVLGSTRKTTTSSSTIALCRDSKPGEM